MKSYKIFASLIEDSISGFVWSDDKNIPNGFIVIKNGKKKIRVYKREIDNNWIKRYNKAGEGRRLIKLTGENLVISEFYRSELEIQTKKSYQLTIEKGCKWINFFTSNFNHPNPYIGPNIFLAVIIAMCSFGLSFGFATYSFFSTKNYRSQLNKNFKEWTIDIKEESSSLKKSIDEVKGIISNPDSNGNSLTDNISEMESILENLSEGERIELEVLEDLKNSTEEIKKKSDSIDKRIAKIEGFNQNIHLKNDDIESKIKK